MAQESIRLKAQLNDNFIEVKAVIRHPMETGMRKDKNSKQLIPANFITEVSCEHNDQIVFVANWGAAVSTNPFLSFRIKEGRGGDRIKISWIDNQGDSDAAETTVA